ncbi:UNVERIFIED_CONTAM: hypothetical protein NY100_00515 [Prevotella sp. 15_C9]
MKKVFILAIVVASVTFAGCGNKSNPSANAETDSTELSVADSVNALASEVPEDAKALVKNLAEKLNSKDANGIISVIQGAKAKAVEMAKNNPEKAKEYLSMLQSWVKSNSESIKNIVANAGNSALSKSLNGAIETVTSANPDVLLKDLTNTADGLKDVGTKALDNAAQKGEENVEAVKKNIENVSAKAQEKAEQKVKDARAETSKKVNDATNKAENKAHKAIDEAGKAVKGLGL